MRRRDMIGKGAPNVRPDTEITIAWLGPKTRRL